MRVYGVRVPEVVETAVLETAEERVVQTVDELKVVESSKESTKTVPEIESATVVEAEAKEVAKALLMSEVSSVTTLVEEETDAPVKKAAKRGRPKATTVGAVAVAAAKLTAPKKKAKGRTASAMDEEDEAGAEPVAVASPRSKKVKEAKEPKE